MNILDLPIEILAIITTADLDTFLAALKVPGIGPRLCHEYIQNYAKKEFITVMDDMWHTRYYLGGKLHRVGGPAVIRKEGWTTFSWPYSKKYKSISEYTNDEPIFNSGGMVYYKGGSTLIHIRGMEEYYIHGKHHNSQGAAIIHENGAKEFWINGEFMYGFDAICKN